MEDWPYFNAGTGSAMTENETVEMDAFIMEGGKRGVGADTAVAAANNLKHPVSAARLVMERTDHCLLTGNAAMRFLKDLGAEEATDEELITENSRRRFMEEKRQCSGAANAFQSTCINTGFKEHDTVGAVAVDARGRLAAATSTGGITGKMLGRVGDSPIAGSGGWADDKLGAISTTGHGEVIMRSCLGYGWAVAQKDSVDEATAETAAREVLREMAERMDGRAGLVAVTPRGSVVRAFTTPRMTWAYIRQADEMVHYGVLPEDDFTEEAK